MEHEQRVNQFNSELAFEHAELVQTIEKIQSRLDQGETPEEQIQQLQQDYKDLSRKRITFIPEKESFTTTKPLQALKQPTRKNHDKPRGLDAHEPDLLEHKQYLDGKRQTTLKRAQQLYQTYRQQQGLEPVKPEINIPSAIEELEKLKENKTQHIHALRDYMNEARKVKNGEKRAQQTDQAIPEDQDLLEDQINRAADRIYESLQTIENKQQQINEYVQELKQQQEETSPIEISIKYGITPLEASVRKNEDRLDDISTGWKSLANTVQKDLPEKYSERITQRQNINI